MKVQKDTSHGQLQNSEKKLALALSDATPRPLSTHRRVVQAAQVMEAQGEVGCGATCGIAWQAIWQNKNQSERKKETKNTTYGRNGVFSYLCSNRSCRKQRGSAERQHKQSGIWPEQKQRSNSCRIFSEIKRSRSVLVPWDFLLIGPYQVPKQLNYWRWHLKEFWSVINSQSVLYPLLCARQSAI